MTTADVTTVRTWARNNGFTTGDRGRLSAKVLDAYAAAHTGPGTGPSVRAVAKKASAPATSSTVKAAGATATSTRTSATVAFKKATPAKHRATKMPAGATTATAGKTTATTASTTKATPTTGPAHRATAKRATANRATVKKAPTSVAARKATAAGPAGEPVAAKVHSTRRVKTVLPASPVLVRSARPEPSAAAVESAPLHRLVALEKQFADLTSRLAAVESASGAAGSNGAATQAKPTRKFSPRR